jgi:hypothetical protein
MQVHVCPQWQYSLPSLDDPRLRGHHQRTETKDIIIAVFGAAVGLAGILLVFVGFVYSRVETFDLADQRDKFRFVAKCGVAPFLIALISATLCLRWMTNQSLIVEHLAICLFYVGLALTALYGVVAFLFYL